MIQEVPTKFAPLACVEPGWLAKKPEDMMQHRRSHENWITAAHLGYLKLSFLHLMCITTDHIKTCYKTLMLHMKKTVYVNDLHKK